MIELNPIRMKKNGKRPLPVACDVKAAFDQDDPAHERIKFPNEVFATELTEFETEINQLRTYQGQSDVVELNPNGTILPFMFGGGANSAATEVLGDKAIFSSDFGGNPPYAKMKEIATICYKHFLKNANIVQIIGGKANNTDIFVTIKAMMDALRENIKLNPDIHVVIGRGGPNLVQGMIYARDLLDSLKIPYKMFGFDSSMIGVLNYTLELDAWIEAKKISADPKP
jgi:succinyl-CoA synthetase beta subunit